jgi:hypothetical protein
MGNSGPSPILHRSSHLLHMPLHGLALASQLLLMLLGWVFILAAGLQPSAPAARAAPSPGSEVYQMRKSAKSKVHTKTCLQISHCCCFPGALLSGIRLGIARGLHAQHSNISINRW